MTTAPSPTDPFAMLEQDHREVDALLHQLTVAAPESDEDRVVVLARLQQALSVHMDFEESEIYPLIARTIGAREADDRHAEHDDVRAGLGRLETLTDDEKDGEFTQALAEIQGAISRHVGVEESDLFPRLREAVGAGEQEHLCAALSALREAAR